MSYIQYIFWQNTNSLHQSAFFKALAEKNPGCVTLVVTEKLPDSRKEMGWFEPELPGVQVVKFLNNSFDWKMFIKKNNSKSCIHIFSGIAAFRNVQMVFEFAAASKCRIGIFTEPLDFRGIKGSIRRLRGYYHKIKYSSKIELVLTTGDLGVKQFWDWGYNRNKIFEWAYTVEKSDNQVRYFPDESGKYRILFAGSLIKRKGFDILISALEKLSSDNFIADFYCLSEKQLHLEEDLKVNSIASINNKLAFHPFVSNQKLRSLMNSYDLFVLPSRHDGWGAVVCESLMEGTPVLVSKFCGSSSIIKNNTIGSVIKELSSTKLSEQIHRGYLQGRVTNTQRIWIRTWAEENISGEAMAQYFERIVDYLNNSMIAKPDAPWQRNII